MKVETAAPVQAASRVPRPVPDLARNVHCILGLPFDLVTLGEAQARVRDAALQGRRCFVSTPNLNFVVACQDDPEFRDSVLRSDLSAVDGMPLVWVARLLGIPVPGRVAGASLFEALRADPGQPVGVFFFGGPDGAARRACERLDAQGGGLRGAGHLSPGFGSVEEMSSDAVIGEINRSGAGLLSVALGARKGQQWILRNLGRLEVPVVCHLGAVVNFTAGNVRRAPAWMQGLGLEWAWRVYEEPALWRRYFDDGRAFVRLLLARVLPLMLRQRLQAPRPQDVAQAGAAVTLGAGTATLRLSGAWTAGNAPGLQQALTRVLAGGYRHVVVDVSALRFLDSACLGLLLVFRGQLQNACAELRMEGAAPALRRLLRLHCAEYLLAPISPQVRR